MNRASLALFSLLLAVPLTGAAQTTDLPTPTTNAPPSSVTVPAPPETNAATTPASPPIPADAPPPPLQVGTPGGPGPANGAQPEDIDDIRPPFFFPHTWFWVGIALVTAAAVALIALLWHFFKPHRLLSAKSAYELTLEKLEKARAMLREDQPMPYAVFVSETIRSYLGQRFETPSTRRTTDEFLRLMEKNPNTPLAGHRDLLSHFLQSCDLVKFARYQPTLAELEEVQQRAWNFVTATKPQPAPQNGSRP